MPCPTLDRSAAGVRLPGAAHYAPLGKSQSWTLGRRSVISLEVRVSTAKRFEVTSVGPRLCRLEVPTVFVDIAAPRPRPRSSAARLPELNQSFFSTEPSVRSLLERWSVYGRPVGRDEESGE